MTAPVAGHTGADTAKYGNSVEKIQEYAGIKQQELDRLNHYETCKKEQEARLSILENQLSDLREKFSWLCGACAKKFERKPVQLARILGIGPACPNRYTHSGIP